MPGPMSQDLRRTDRARGSERGRLDSGEAAQRSSPVSPFGRDQADAAGPAGTTGSPGTGALSAAIAVRCWRRMRPTSRRLIEAAPQDITLVELQAALVSIGAAWHFGAALHRRRRHRRRGGSTNPRTRSAGIGLRHIKSPRGRPSRTGPTSRAGADGGAAGSCYSWTRARLASLWTGPAPPRTRTRR